ncbi:M15 family metallopeptidase [Planococcus chinensis]|uniref:D-alanyl-D-alanine carboxypeptidase family protein n=1 Tax=Planococcus chinensis TaxID=272917 RepID=A0ABW4QJ98_9BACL
MKSRNSFQQNQKKPYIKWTLIGVLSLAVLAAASWLFANDWNVERSLSAFRSTETEVPDGQPEAPTEEAPVPENPQEETPAEPAPPVEETPETPAEPVTPPAEEAPETPAEPEEPAPPAEEKPAVQEKPADATQYPPNITLPQKPTFIKGILLANKHYPLPQNYAPGESKEARAAFESMKQAAKAEGINLHAFSTYREFARQKVLYEGYVAKDGQQAADRYSARPGFSEHQTGLAFDIGEAGQEQHWASTSFGATAGGKWLKANAHKFGFILRYPEGAERLTGYMHESWHFRYVGTEAAAKIFSTGMTLEQYLGVQ